MTDPDPVETRNCLPNSSAYLSYSGRGGDPALAVERFLLSRGLERLTVLQHPLQREQVDGHIQRVFTRGTLTRSRRWRLPHHPPLTHVLDVLIDLSAPRSDLWVGLSPLASAVGLLHRSAGRVRTVIHYSIDFTPSRFSNRLLNALYQRLDKFCMESADVHVEVSEAARDARRVEYGTSPDIRTPLVVPMGIPVATSEADPPRNPHQLVFLGSLEERMGTDILPKVLARVRQRIPDATLHIIGDGPKRSVLAKLVRSAKLDDAVTFHGFLEPQGEVQNLLKRSAIGLAPYVPFPGNFTQFADPGKIKAYASAGLPIVLTAVPPNAWELAERGLGYIRDYSPDDFASACIALMTSTNAWEEAHQAASDYADSYQWSKLLKPVFEDYI